MTISGWAGLTLAHAETNGIGFDGADVEQIDSGAENDDLPWHLEGFYRYPVSKNISINPGLLAVINPEGNSDRDTIYVGTIRTIFKF